MEAYILEVERVDFGWRMFLRAKTSKRPDTKT
jgi:hypothetical protein